MQILIVRHGQAVDDAPGLGDSGRWLTGKGRKVTRRVARWMTKRKGSRPAAIWTSPLVRAVQTAEIVAGAAELTDQVTVVPELSPGRDPADLLRLLSSHRGPEPLALVGHEPQLSLLITSLIGEAAWAGLQGTDDAEARPKLKKSGVAAIRWDGRGSATLRFLLDPKEMSAVSGVGAKATGDRGKRGKRGKGGKRGKSNEDRGEQEQKRLDAPDAPDAPHAEDRAGDSAPHA